MRSDRAEHERLVRTNMGLVRTVAARYRGLGLAYDDLVQEGSLGLLDAIEHHDPARGPFEPYARFRIRRAIRSALTEKSRLIRLPKQVVERRRAIDHASARLAAERGRVPSAHDVAVALDLRDSDLALLPSIAPASLDQPVADAAAVDPEEAVEFREQTERLDRLVSSLPARQREIVARHFGLGCAPESLRTVALSLHLSDQRVRAIEQKALATLRDALDPRQV